MPHPAWTWVSYPEKTVIMQGADPLRYRWLREGLRIHMPTAHTATIHLKSLTPVDAGMFQCRVTNADGTALSSPALVVVNPAVLLQAEPLIFEEPALVQQRSLQPKPAEAAPSFLNPEADETASASDDDGPARTPMAPESLPDDTSQGTSEFNAEAEAPAAVPEDFHADAHNIEASPEEIVVTEKPAEPPGPSSEHAVTAEEAKPVAEPPSSSTSEAGYASQLF